jgi:hypothetical protein
MLCISASSFGFAAAAATLPAHQQSTQGQLLFSSAVSGLFRMGPSTFRSKELTVGASWNNFNLHFGWMKDNLLKKVLVFYRALTYPPLCTTVTVENSPVQIASSSTFAATGELPDRMKLPAALGPNSSL